MRTHNHFVLLESEKKTRYTKWVFLFFYLYEKIEVWRLENKKSRIGKNPIHSWSGWVSSKLPFSLPYLGFTLSLCVYVSVLFNGVHLICKSWFRIEYTISNGESQKSMYWQFIRNNWSNFRSEFYVWLLLLLLLVSLLRLQQPTELLEELTKKSKRSRGQKKEEEEDSWITEWHFCLTKMRNSNWNWKVEQGKQIGIRIMYIKR